MTVLGGIEYTAGGEIYRMCGPQDLTTQCFEPPDREAALRQS
jgi:hypothetical protein